MRALVIACSRPGLLRGGVRHPAIARHALDAFTPEQLRELLAEPALAVAIGEPLSPQFLDEMEATRRAQAPAAGNRPEKKR